jgi:hypothetical protein
MNEQGINEIEQRLQAMQPAAPGPQVKQRIAQTLEEDSAEAHRPLLFRRPMVVGLAAAAVLAFSALITVLLLNSPDDTGVVISEPPPVQYPDDVTPPATPTTPTLFALTQAWNQSPDAMDELLDQAQPPLGHRYAMTPTQTPTPADTEQWSKMKELP